MLTAVALIVSVISNELYKRGTEEFPRDGPKWLQSVLTFYLNKTPSIVYSYNVQVSDRDIIPFFFFKLRECSAVKCGNR